MHLKGDFQCKYIVCVHFLDASFNDNLTGFVENSADFVGVLLSRYGCFQFMHQCWINTQLSQPTLNFHSESRAEYRRSQFNHCNCSSSAVTPISRLSTI